MSAELLLLRCCLLLTRTAAAGAVVHNGGRETVSFNYAYRFKHGLAYGQYKPKGSVTPNITIAPERLPTTDDSGWDVVDVPHDMLIGGVYAQKGDRLEAACLPRGDGWYRKHFRLPSDWQGKAVWLAFEGVWQRTTVFLNGQLLNVDRAHSFEPDTPSNPGNPAWWGNGTAEFYEGHWQGYTGFTLRLDNATKINFGAAAENVLAVHVDALHGTGWWYEGGGIYRPVWLVAAPPVHFAPDEVFGTAMVTGSVSRNGAAAAAGLTAPATIHARAVLENFGSTAAAMTGLSVRFTAYNAVGKACAEGTAAVVTNPNGGGETAIVNASLSLAKAELWSVARPYLYTITATVLGAHTGATADVGDSVNITIGVRSMVRQKNRFACGILLPHPLHCCV